jgi:hypothetical protein
MQATTADTVLTGPADAVPGNRSSDTPSVEPVSGGVTHVARPFLALLANVAVVTGLLVYFGWRRSATQSQRLGIDESILGMSTRDYVLRSVGPVLRLLVGVAIVGLVGASLDRPIRAWVGRSETGERPPRATVVLGMLSLAWLILPVLVLAGRRVAPDAAFVLFPASIGLGVVLLLYAAHLRNGERADEAEGRRMTVRLSAGALLVGLCLFWTASNYAVVLGADLADALAGHVSALPAVAVLSEQRLHLEAVGAAETDLDPTTSEGLRYRYTGLRLLEHTGGRYFLIGDQWAPGSGAVTALRDDDTDMRLDFGHIG